MNIAAVILAAGKGTRMGSVEGSEKPKVMHLANGKPMVEYSIKAIKESGVHRVVLVIGYKREQVEEYFGQSVEYALQEEQLGTGHAVMMAKPNLEGQSDAVLTCYGDMPLFKAETIRRLIDKFEEEKPAIAMLTVDFEDPEFWAFGRIIRNEEGYVVANVEQKDCAPEQLKIKESNPGFYIFDAEFLWANIEKLKAENAQAEYYLPDLIKMANDQGKKIVAVKVSSEDEVLGVNTPEQLAKAEEILIQREKEAADMSAGEVATA